MSLEDTGQYQVRLVQSGKEARAASSHSVFQLAIIDAALQDELFVLLCKELLHQQTGLRLVVIPPENNPNHPSLGGLLPHGYLSRPFYLPDLLDTVSRLLSDRDVQLQSQRLPTGEMAPSNTPAASLPLWLQEPLTLRGYLEKELLNTQALGALIGLSTARPGTGILRANAGRLDDTSAHELSSVVFRYWNRNEKTDLMRFIRIARDKKDYLIYATQVTGDLVLVLIYDTAAPLSLIRPQSKNMAQNLATVPPDGYYFPNSSAAPFTVPDYPAVEKPLPSADNPPPAIQPPTSWAGSAPEAAERPGDSGSAAPAAQTGESAASPVSDVPAPADAAERSVEAGSDQPNNSGSVPPFIEDENTFRAAIMEPETQPLEDVDFLRRLRSGFGPSEEPLAETSTPSAPAGPDAEIPATAETLTTSGTPSPAGTSNESAFLDSLEDDEDIAGDIINLTALLGSIPPPDPASTDTPGAGWIPERFAGQPIPTLTPNSMESFGSGPIPGGDTVPGSQAAPDNQTEGRGQNTGPQAEQAEAAAPEAQTGQPLPDHAEKLAADELMAADELLSADSEETQAKPERIPAAREVKTEPPTPLAGPTPILPQPPPTRSLLSHKPAEEAQSTAPDQANESSSEPIVPEPVAPKRSAVPAVSRPVPALEPAPLNQAEADLDLDEPPINPLEDTRPRVVASITHLSQLESASPALSLLNYTCVLVPRLPQHYLTGELADKLALWVHQLCLAFGWRLEGIAIRPEYLQWSVQVAPAISPGNLVKIIRQRTSIHIFNAYDHLAQQNPSGDFWAPGYLIVSGAQPPSAQLLRDYIVQTRKRQGINK